MPLDGIARSALYWFHWNTLILSRYPEATVLQLETVTGPKLLEALNKVNANNTKLPETIKSSSFHTSPVQEKLKLPDVTWSQLWKEDEVLAQSILDLAQRFGYEQGRTMEELTNGA
eukprot:CAMPEP_0184042894 /NCGR_PEP_ID=MMETSP0955-20130417/66615_1 /TAXON_ID=627963 /ORGANISM="Aplanochytrium sp, Strain PBS07" /LENGTH=115 /DNA_ID=CAMNT_0026333733 /DNA_START=303 /DNA_END=650 /DNA_ORIENTATION=+